MKKTLQIIAVFLLVSSLLAWPVWEFGGFRQKRDEKQAMEAVRALPGVVPDTVSVLGNPIDGGPMPNGGPIYVKFGMEGDQNRASRTAIVVDGEIERRF